MHKLTDLCFFLVYQYNLCFHTHHVCKCKPLKHFHNTVKKKKTKPKIWDTKLCACTLN